MTSALFRRFGPTAGQIRRLRSPERPLRLLLIRERQGELPWIVQAITQIMAPVDLVQVQGLANGLWRLGRERFDSVLLDLDPNDRAGAANCRRHIADVTSIPVLDLSSEETGSKPAAGPEPRSSRWLPRTPRRRPSYAQPWPARRASAAGGGD